MKAANLIGLIRPADYLVLFLAIALTTFSYFWVRTGGEAALVRVRWEGREYLYPLDEEKTLVLEGERGVNTVVITGDGEVYMADADCHDKICLTMGTISRSGEYIACLPHRLIITIEGEEDEEIDALIW